MKKYGQSLAKRLGGFSAFSFLRCYARLGDFRHNLLHGCYTGSGLHCFQERRTAARMSRQHEYFRSWAT
jgi:hypothetical protein